MRKTSGTVRAEFRSLSFPTFASSVPTLVLQVSTSVTIPSRTRRLATSSVGRLEQAFGNSLERGWDMPFS